MSVRKIPKNRITKDGRSYAFIVTEYGLDGKDININQKHI